MRSSRGFLKKEKEGKIWNASRICVSSLRRGHANLLCIVPILLYVLPEQHVHTCTSFVNMYVTAYCACVLRWSARGRSGRVPVRRPGSTEKAARDHSCLSLSARRDIYIFIYILIVRMRLCERTLADFLYISHNAM